MSLLVGQAVKTVCDRKYWKFIKNEFEALYNETYTETEIMHRLVIEKLNDIYIRNTDDGI